MKSRLYIFLATIGLTIIAGSCKKSFDDLNVNDNKPVSVPASLLFNGVLNKMYEAPYTMYERWSQYYCCNYDYYGNNRYDFGSQTDYYDVLKNVIKMEEQAKLTGGEDINPYEALGKFFRAYFFTKMSLQVGDLPMEEALQGLGNFTPKYNTQKEIFVNSLQWLEEANADLGVLNQAPSSNTADGQTLKGDIYLSNDLKKWQKVVNAYRLRLLVQLSKKTSDPDLHVSQQFTEILADPAKYPLLESMEDNLQYTYVHPTNDYPMNPNNFGFDALRYNTSATYVSLLTQTSDPRVFVTAEPATALVASGTSPTSYSAFVGASPGEDLGEMYAKTNRGEYSLINRKRYYQTYTGEPSIQIGYPEMLLNIAEAINRDWVTTGPLGNAEDHYKAAIKASMAFYGIPETGLFSVEFLKSGSPGSTATYESHAVPVDFDTYYNQASVKYSTDESAALTQILNQKYIALFRHSGLESYFTYRRTGIPTFTMGPGTGNSERIALRFKYTGSEATANTENYQAALQAQYGGNDDINARMWIIN